MQGACWLISQRYAKPCMFIGSIKPFDPAISRVYVCICMRLCGRVRRTVRAVSRVSCTNARRAQKKIDDRHGNPYKYIHNAPRSVARAYACMCIDAMLLIFLFSMLVCCVRLRTACARGGTTAAGCVQTYKRARVRGAFGCWLAG